MREILVGGPHDKDSQSALCRLPAVASPGAYQKCMFSGPVSRPLELEAQTGRLSHLRLPSPAGASGKRGLGPAAPKFLEGMKDERFPVS